MDGFPLGLPATDEAGDGGRDALPVPSPCVGICTLDSSGVCEGCLRTGAEIAAWPCMSPGDQRRLLAELSARWAALGL